MERHTKIVATLGPASQEEDTVRQLLKSGVDVVRLNFSHGSHELHASRFNLIRRLAKELGRAITILQDLQGPKIRTGRLIDGRVELEAGQPLTLTTEDIPGDKQTVSVDFRDLPRYVQPSGRILLADGQMELVVTAVGKDSVETQIVLGGTLTERKGVNLPGAKLDIPSLTPKDENDLAFGLDLGVDAVAISFVRKANDIALLRKTITQLRPHHIGTPIIAKLERPEALDNLEDILQNSDGVMVARGDLGVEMSPEMVPIAQKRIIEAANRHGKVVITATQMLESMIHNPRPTRAEASDVANAIFDGSDAVMLSGETAIGDYPVKTVQMMEAIISQAEDHLTEWGLWHNQTLDEAGGASFITRAACDLAMDSNVAAIAVFTRSGRTARLMSKARPFPKILAFTPEETTYQRLPLYWGVTPHLVPPVDTVEAMLSTVEATIIERTPIEAGQQIVLVCGYPVGAMGPPNLAMMHTVQGQAGS